jgi:hypothetical protein
MTYLSKLTATLLLTFSFFAAQAQVHLALNYQKGKTYIQKMDFDIDQEAAGNKTKMLMKGTYSMVVTAENDSVKTIRTTYDHIAVSMDMGEMQFSIDSDKPDTSGGFEMTAFMSRMFNAMIGKSITLKVNREGKVLSVEGVEQIKSDVINSMKVPEAMRTGAEAGFGQQFNENSMKENFGQVFGFLPNKVVKVGDSWTRTSSGNTAVDMQQTYAVKSIHGDEVQLEANGKVTITNGGQSMSGTQKSVMTVSAASGQILKSETTQELDGDAKMHSKGIIEGFVK